MSHPALSVLLCLLVTAHASCGSTGQRLRGRQLTRRTHPYILDGEVTVLGVALLRQRLAQRQIEEFYHGPRGVDILEEQEDHRALVQEVDAHWHQNSPERWDGRRLEGALADVQKRQGLT